MNDLPGKPESPGFLIEDTFYPAFSPSLYGPQDAILVENLTGLNWGEFATALDERAKVERELPKDEWPPLDMKIFTGIIALSVWQKRRDWGRDQMVRFMNRLSFEGIDIISPDDRGADAGPPDDGSTPGYTETSGDPSESTEERSATSPAPTGLHSSEITAA